jgi:8-oxo-dGTP diphosphatase
VAGRTAFCAWHWPMPAPFPDGTVATMNGDGAGWVDCLCGGRHWGLFGAAGLLLAVPGPSTRILLQHRAPWSHQGDTWGLPGGAIDSHEDALAAALRETREETGISGEGIVVRGQISVSHGPWAYTTLVATIASPVALTPCAESLALEWVPLHQVGQRAMHPGLKDAWPQLVSLLP